MTKRGDRLSVMLFSLAAFLTVLALLGSQLTSKPAAGAHATALVRKVYETTVVEQVIGARPGPSGTSVSQSASASASEAPLPVATRTS